MKQPTKYQQRSFPTSDQTAKNVRSRHHERCQCLGQNQQSSTQRCNDLRVLSSSWVFWTILLSITTSEVGAFVPREFRTSQRHVSVFHSSSLSSKTTTLGPRLATFIEASASPSLSLQNKLDNIFSSTQDSLPIYDILDELVQAMQDKPNLLLEAPPGAGKTTVVPLAMLHDQLRKQFASTNKNGMYKIWVVEPRRVAARSAAMRMSSTLEESVGATVGYQMRGESRVSSKTQVTVVTDGILLQKLRSDPELHGIDLVIFDEFHERGVDADVALALCRQVQQVWREDLQIIVMSATLLGDLHSDGESMIPASKLVNSLGGADQCQIVRSDGRQFPINVYHANEIQWNKVIRPLPLRVLKKDRKELVNVMCDAILQGISRAPARGDVLAFLPGAAEIRRTCRQLSDQVPADVEIVPLYGALSKEEQDYALFPRPNRRRIIVSSPIAEASLTLERVTCVVDSGLRREPRCDVDTKMPRLISSLCSKASATQRAGRAGRVQEGICLRIYTESEFEQGMKEQTDPEIFSTDLSSTALLLTSWGCGSREEILEDVPFVDPPPGDALDSSIRLLADLGAISDERGRLSIQTLGAEISKIPTHPRFACCIQQVKDNPVGLAAAVVVAFLLDDDIGARAPGNSPDLALRVLQLFQSFEMQQSSLTMNALVRFASRISTHAADVIQDSLSGNIVLSDIVRAIGPSLIWGFEDLIAERKGDASYGGFAYLLSLGRSARLDEYKGNGEAPDYAVVVETSTSDDGKTRIRAFANVDKAILIEKSSEREVVFTVPSRGHEVRAKLVRGVGSIELDSTPLPAPSPEKVNEILKDTIRKMGGYRVALNQIMTPDKKGKVDGLCYRVKLASELSTEGSPPWPECFAAFIEGDEGADETLQALLDPWLAPAGSLKKLDLYEILQSSLSPVQKRQLENDFPSKIEAPDGSQIPVCYLARPPSATAKLQQFFGTPVSPSVGPAGNPVRLSLSLLSPGGKVVAQTMDLPFFWSETYPQVRAELRGRYAKHPWPENPMTAVATRQTKKQLEAVSTDATKQNDPSANSKKKRRKKK